MTDDVQPGVRIDPALWERFRENIKQRRGAVRGNLRRELENAIRLYIDGDPDSPSQQINARLARIEGELGIAEADGGTTPSDAGDTHTRPEPSPEPVEEKPPSNAPTEKKIRYLANEIGSDPDTVPPEVLRETVKDEYGFRSDTAKRYVERLVEYYDLVEHPDAHVDILVSRERRRELLEAEADAELSEVSADD